MANVDNPRGFWPVRHLTGGQIRTNSYPMTASSTIYKGDLVKVVDGGTVEIGAADIGLAAVGVAAEYAVSAATGTTMIQVYDDPYIVFGVQADSGTAVASTERFETANHVATTGSATTKLSANELDSSDIATGAQLKIIGIIDEPSNTWAEHVDLEVIFNEHLYKAAVAGV